MLALLATAPSAGAVTAARIVELLNAQRAAHGIPGDIAERPDWSAACAQHNKYMRDTGKIDHVEDPNHPSYTPEGDFAGRNSVLAKGVPGPDWEQGNPFETAPIHLSQLLTPRLASMGADDDGTHVCATTFPGYSRQPPAAPTIYSYPGDGASGFRTEERAMESPFVPGDFVGLPGGTLTGPYMQVFLFGATGSSSQVRLTEAVLTGPNGPVAVKTLDSTHPQVGPYLPGPMAFVIPEKPLTHGVHRLRVTFSDAGTPVSKPIQFGATAESGPHDGAGEGGTGLRFGNGRLRNDKVSFQLIAGPGLVGEKATITITRESMPDGRAKRTITLKAKQRITTAAPRKRERVKVKAVVPGRATASARFPG